MALHAAASRRAATTSAPARSTAKARKGREAQARFRKVGAAGSHDQEAPGGQGS